MQGMKQDRNSLFAPPITSLDKSSTKKTFFHLNSIKEDNELLDPLYEKKAREARTNPFRNSYKQNSSNLNTISENQKSNTLVSGGSNSDSKSKPSTELLLNNFRSFEDEQPEGKLFAFNGERASELNHLNIFNSKEKRLSFGSRLTECITCFII